MNNAQETKDMVRAKYAEIALQDKDTNASSCCGAGGCSTEVYNIMTDDYTQVEGYNPDADLGLGCGLPTQFAGSSRAIRCSTWEAALVTTVSWPAATRPEDV
jgi:arsenite methyltransferase